MPPAPWEPPRPSREMQIVVGIMLGGPALLIYGPILLYLIFGDDLPVFLTKLLNSI